MACSICNTSGPIFRLASKCSMASPGCHCLCLSESMSHFLTEDITMEGGVPSCLAWNKPPQVAYGFRVMCRVDSKIGGGRMQMACYKFVCGEFWANWTVSALLSKIMPLCSLSLSKELCTTGN
uniref:Uncharacterized protein n=1 Tax=Eutreptiella gymnastica TaxID=73025 RepID=A0A7S4LD52_9EUGL